LKVLIVKLSAFGDIIHALPALDDVLARPEVSEVHWLVDSRFAFVTEIFPPQVKVHKVALKGTHRIRHAWRMIQTLRRENFDIILELQGLIKSGLMAWGATKSHTRVYGFDRQQSPEYPNHWFVNTVDFHADEQHVVQKYRHIATAPFISQSDAALPTPYKAPHVKFKASNANLLQTLGIQAQHYTLLHVGGGWKTKQLPETTWQQLNQTLELQQTQVIISWGSESEQSLAQSIAKNSNAIVLPQRLEIHALCQLLQQSQAVIGMDTGVLHLAAALQASTITLWGPSASWNSAPLGTQHRHIESNPECGPCFKRQCDDFICMPSLSAQTIVKAWLEVKK